MCVDTIRWKGVLALQPVRRISETGADITPKIGVYPHQVLI